MRTASRAFIDALSCSRILCTIVMAVRSSRVVSGLRPLSYAGPASGGHHTAVVSDAAVGRRFVPGSAAVVI